MDGRILVYILITFARGSEGVNGTCPADNFQCHNNKCIPSWRLCNGHDNCWDRSDEILCDTCKAEAFHCDKIRCIWDRRLCDSSPDCDDNSDETNCDMATNKYGVLKIREPVFKNKDVELSFQLSAGFSPTQVGPIRWKYTRMYWLNEITISESKRVSFSELNATYSMLIKEADDNDQGSYRVYLSAVSGYSLYVKLTLQELPKNVQFTSPNKSYPGCRNCSYAEIGHGLEVECSYTDGSEEEETVVIQIHSLNAQKATYTASRQSRGRYVARISDIREQNHLANVTCEVSAPSLPHPLTATSKLYVLRRPAKPILTIGVLKEGNSSNISCLSDNSRPPSKLYYKLGENKITVNQTDESYVGSGSSLSYRSVATLTSLERVWNNQMITCCLQHETLSHPLCSDRVKILYEYSLATSRVQNVMIVAIVAPAMVLLVATIAVMFVCIRKKRHRQEITQQEPSAEPAQPAEQAILYQQLNREDMVHSSLYNELEIPIYANET